MEKIVERLTEIIRKDDQNRVCAWKRTPKDVIVVQDVCENGSSNEARENKIGFGRCPVEPHKASTEKRFFSHAEEAGAVPTDRQQEKRGDHLRDHHRRSDDCLTRIFPSLVCKQSELSGGDFGQPFQWRHDQRGTKFRLSLWRNPPKSRGQSNAESWIWISELDRFRWLRRLRDLRLDKRLGKFRYDPYSDDRELCT